MELKTQLKIVNRVARLTTFHPEVLEDVVMQRRNFIMGLVPVSMAAYSILAAKQAKAQINRNIEVLYQLEKLTKSAEQLEFNVVSSGPALFQTQASSFADQDMYIVSGVVQSLAKAENAEIANYTRSDTTTLVRIMESYKVPLRPNPSDLDIQEYYNTNQPRYKRISEEKPTVAGVIFSIICDAFSIPGGARLAVVKFLVGRPELQTLVNEIAQATKAKDWHKSSRLIARLINSIVDRRLLAALEKQVGQRVVRRILVVFAARCVPFIGTALMVVGVVSSLYNNWGDLEQVLRG